MSYIVETKFKIQTAQDVKLCGPYIAEAIPQIDIKVNGVSIEPTIKETGSGTDRFYACYQFPNTGTYNVTFTFPYPDWVNFRDCVFLSEVTLPEGITEIQDYAFYHTGIESIVIPDGVTSIGVLSFSESNLKSIYIPASVTSIVEGSSFLYTPYLESITVDPENAIYDSRDNCNCIIKDSTIIVGSKNYVIPASVNRIGKYAFYKHQFESFVIPYNITHIDEYAFSECNNFNKLYIGSQLSHIGEYAFSNCYHLHTIYSSAVTPPAYSNSSFYGLGNSIPARQGYLYVPLEAIPNYEAEWTYLTDTLGWIINEWVPESATVSLDVPTEGGTYEIEPTELATWNVTSCPDWITPSAPTGTNLSIEVSQNNSVSNREGVVLFTSGSASVTTNVTQNGINVDISTSNVSFDSSGGTQTITVTGISGFGVTNLKRKDVSVTIDGSSIIIDCPAIGGIVDWKDTFDITYYGDVVTSIEVAQSGSNYTVTPPTSRFGLEGGEQLITITSDYPLRDYFYYEDANGTKHYNFEIINYNEIRILYSLPASDTDNYIQPLLYSSMSYIKPIPLTNIFQGRYLDANLWLGEDTTLNPLSNILIFEIKSDVDWTINTDNCLVGRNDISNEWNDSWTGSGNDVLYIKCSEWFTYTGPRTLTVTITSELGQKVFTVTQNNEIPWISFNIPNNKIAHTGGSIIVDDYNAVTNCKNVTLSVSDGTVTPTTHTGKWGETTSMDLVWEIPPSDAERTLTITGTTQVSDGTLVTGSFNVTQLSPYTFSADIHSFRSISVDGGSYTMEYTTDAPNVELELTKAKDFITDFSYTQPVNGVGTFTLTYADAHYTNGRSSTPTVVAKYDGVQIGSVKLDDYQLGTGFWIPDTSQTISHLEQIIEVPVHNISCDLKESNLSLHQSIPGLSVVSYTPSTPDSSGILYVKVPFNKGPERTFRIQVDALDNNGKVFKTESGITITQLEIPPIIYLDFTFDAAFHREEIEHKLVGDWWVLSKVNWIQSETSDGTDPSSIVIRIGGNPTKNTRVGYVYIYGEDQTYIIQITQNPIDFSFDPDGNLIPICEEITYSENTDKLDYLVVDQEYEGLKYVGRAHKYPDSDSVTIELNDIFSDTLRNNITFTEGLQEMDGYMKKFGVQNQNTGGGQIYYSYKAWEKPIWPLLNDPISNEVDPRQHLFVNYIDGYGDMTLFKNGDPLASLGKKAGCAYLVPREDAICGEEVWFDVKLDGTVLAVQSFKYQQTNKNYALYYVNAYGGWDSLAIRGNVTQTDNIQSQTYKNKSNGKVKYLNQVTPTWSLNTDAISDASKMYHLLESTQVYLHNLETDEIIPVVITDTSCVYKTYSNQGNTRFHYTINVEAANYKIRK